MDAGAWCLGNDENEIVFRFYGNEAMLTQEQWGELCSIIDDIRNGKEIALSKGYLELRNHNRQLRRVPVGEKITLEMLGLSVTPKKPEFSKPIRRF